MRILLIVAAPVVAALVAWSGPGNGTPGATTRVSVASDGSQANGESLISAVSGDGRFVAFETIASNLVPGDGNDRADIYVHDRQTGATERVSSNGSGAGFSGGNYMASIGLDISADGRFVAFESFYASVPQDTNGQADVYVYDRQDEIMELISVDSDEIQIGGLDPAISDNGQFVAFRGLGLGIYVRDRSAGTTDSIGSAENPDISADGRFVVFELGGQVSLHDRQTLTTEIVTAGAGGNSGARISTDGGFVTFASAASNLVPGDTNGSMDVFVWDRVLNATDRVSIDSNGGEGDLFSQWPTISDDGRLVAFVSGATNLAAGDTNGGWDIFVHDRLSGITTRTSVDSGGGQANNSSDFPSVSGDGRVVAFRSFADNLVSGDTAICDFSPPDGTPDINCPDTFVRDLGDADDDGKWDPFDPCPTIANEDPADSDGDLKPDACDGLGSGNVDCNGPLNGVTAVDALKVLRYVAGFSVSQSEPCLEIGQPRLAPATGVMGDVDCDTGVHEVDALKILRAVVGLPVEMPAECPPIIGPPA